MSLPFPPPTALPEGVSLPFPLPTDLPEDMALPFPLPTELPEGMSLPFPLPSDLPENMSPPPGFPGEFPEGMSPPFPIPTDASAPFGPPPGLADGSSMPPLPPSAPVPDMLSIHVYDAIVWTAVALSVITTVMRLYSRLSIVKSFGLDDTLILLGQLVALASAGVARWHADIIWEIREISLPGGRILLFETPRSIELVNLMFRSSLVSDVIYLATLPLIKCSILAFYCRIAHIRKHFYIIYTLAFLIISNAIIDIFLTIFAIEPVSAVWNMMHATAMELRWDHTHIQIANSAFQVLFDLIILAIPIPVILKTKLRRKDRAGLVFIYLLSFFSLAATIVRLLFVVRFSNKLNDVTNIKERIEYSYWAMLEITTAIICANLPALPALYRRLTGRDKVLPLSASNSKSNTQTAALSHSRSAKKWLDSKWSRLLQTTRQTGSGTGRSRIGGAGGGTSSSQTSLTNFNTAGTKNDHVVEINEIGVFSPSKSSFKSSSHMSEKEKEGAAAVDAGASCGLSLVLPPPPGSGEFSVGRGSAAGIVGGEEGGIQRTDVIHVERSLA